MIVDDDLRPRRGARGAEYAGGIVGIVTFGNFRRIAVMRQRREEFVLRIGGTGRAPGAETDAGRWRIADHRGNVDVLVIDDQRRIERRAPVSTICFSLISVLNGQITAPMRQTPSQISSFSRFSSDSSSTRLPFLMPRPFR